MSSEDEFTRLKALLADRDAEISHLKTLLNQNTAGVGQLSISPQSSESSPQVEDDLTKEEISRYSRQLILPQVGAEGQKRLKRSSALLVGAGGLGCPAGIYLAAAGIGHLGVVDYDVVELSNLHRQILHRESSLGTSKAKSLARSIQDLNSSVRMTIHDVQLDRSNALSIISGYDVILDCSDNPATRYLINDASVLAGRPLVSGSALRWEGQLTIYNYKGGPCYRCLYPSPPDPKYVTNCSDGGVIGAVPGLIGTLQAIETIKLLLTDKDKGGGPSYSQKLLVFDAESGLFRTVTLRGRQPNCAVCCSPNNRTIQRLEDVDYALFCGRGPNDKETGIRVLKDEDRVTPRQFQEERTSARPYLLIDVRPQLETSICRLPDSINLPYHSLEERADELKDLIRRHFSTTLDPSAALTTQQSSPFPVYVVCRRGNNSQLAVERIRNSILVPTSEWPVLIRDIVGGLKAWTEQVDPNFPLY